MADYVCINRSYLYTLFQNYLGMSPQQFLTTFRITKARELLESTNYPIESIALSCGYSDCLLYTSLTYDIIQNSIPIEGTYKDATHRKMSVLEVDFEANKKFLQENLYGTGDSTATTETAD